MPRVYFGFDAKSVPGEHIFLSYSRTDEARIKGIALELHKIGLPIWYDDALIPGNLWKKEIRQQVKESCVTVFFLTKELFQRDGTFMIDEYQFAKDHGKPKICIFLDDIANMDCAVLEDEMYFWWLELKKLQSIEVFNLPSDKAKADEIYHGLCRADKRFTQYAPKSEPKPNLTSTTEPTQQPQPVKSTPPTPRKSYRVGDRIPFGQYPQGANGEVQPLMWRVLAVEDGKALLITDKLIDYIRYNKTYTGVTWETCTLRKWMNNDFINKAFSSSQQARIATVTNQNLNNPEYGTKGGNATQDRIFALSIDEAEKYFSSNSDRKAYTTDYAHKKGYDDSDRSEYWWLRSPGDNSHNAAYVFNDGHINQHGIGVNISSVAVRPAFWLNL